MRRGAFPKTLGEDHDERSVMRPALLNTYTTEQAGYRRRAVCFLAVFVAVGFASFRRGFEGLM